MSTQTTTTQAASGAEGELDWLLKEVVELCEHTEDEMHEALEKGPTNEHEIGFYKGCKWEAKGIRRAVAEVVRLRKSELRSFADAAASATAPQPAGAERVDLAELERLSARATSGEWDAEEAGRIMARGTSPGYDIPVWGTILTAHDTKDIEAGVTHWSTDGERQANARYVAALVNAHRAGHLVLATLTASQEQDGEVRS